MNLTKLLNQIIIIMKTPTIKLVSLKALAVFMSLFLAVNIAYSQQLQMSDFVLFSGSGGTGTTNPSSPGYGVFLSSSNTITNGSVGSSVLVQSTGNANINANIYSQRKVTLSNSNVVGGKITAANNTSVTGTILSVGSSANISGNIDVNGNVVIGGGTVSGKVTRPTGTTYSGPAPAGGNVIGTPTLPTFPSLPAITNFPPYPNLPDITTTQTITPGAYDDIKLSGGQTLTFNGPGV